MRFLVVGASGFCGKHFTRRIAERGHEPVGVGRSQCDVYDVDAVAALLRSASPDAVINCAGFTGRPNVEQCEANKADCLAANAYLPAQLAKACGSVGVPFAHVSSGCIYSGRRGDGGGFRESDPPNFSFRHNNCSWYSGTKALGEELLADLPVRYIWRVRFPFSATDSPRNYLSKLLHYERLLDVGNSLSSIAESVDAALDCFEKSAPPGTYHLTNPGSMTTRRVTELMLEAGVTTKQFDFFASEREFQETTSSIPRSNCVLDSSKAIACGLVLTPVEDAVRHTLRLWSTRSTPPRSAI